MNANEAARVLDQSGYDCSVTRNPTIWRVETPSGNLLYLFHSELIHLAKRKS